MNGHARVLTWFAAAMFMLAVWAQPAAAQSASFNTRNYAGSITGQQGFATTTFGFAYGLNIYDMERYHVNGNPIIQTYVHRVDLWGSYAILKDKLSVGMDLSMEIMSGDQSDFTFGHFGLSTTYTFFNRRPVWASVGLGVKLQNQSLTNTFSADMLYFRPFIATGVGLFDRLYITPYLGVPIYIDINEDNDPGDIPQGCGAGTCYPDRHVNYWQDDNPFGLDYGVPVALRLLGSFYLTVEPTGLTWLYPDSSTTLWVTPGVMWQPSPMVMGVGVRIRVYTTEDITDDKYQFVFNVGVNF